jgi:hypothetical protein
VPLLATAPPPIVVAAPAVGAPYIAGDRVLVNGVEARVTDRALTGKGGMTTFLIRYTLSNGAEGWAYVDHDGKGHLAGSRVQPHPDPED